MSPKTAALLADPHPNCHIVYPYTDGRLIAAAVSLYAAGGLSRDEVVILITTPDHRRDIERCLEADQFPVNQFEEKGLLVILDAFEVLSKLRLQGGFDAGRFDQVVGTLIANAKLRSPSGRVRLFGEMVSLLWSDGGDLEAAARLEELWNEAISRYSVPLLCTYELSGTHGDHAELPASLAATHSHSVAV